MRPGFIKPLVMASSIYTGDADSPVWSVPDDEIGFLGRPLRHAAIETIDYSYTSESDEYGFANAGPWPERADIVFLGDSLLTGAGVVACLYVASDVDNAKHFDAWR